MHRRIRDEPARRSETTLMTIVMIQGPGRPRDDGARNAVDTALAERARNAGHDLLRIRCRTEEQLLERLSRIDRGQADIILLDPGRCALPSEPLQSTLRHLEVPYIEVHEDRLDRPEPLLPANSGPRVAVVNGFEAQGYTLAMSMALEQLGCAECENDFNVGT